MNKQELYTLIIDAKESLLKLHNALEADHHYQQLTDIKQRKLYTKVGRMINSLSIHNIL